jgi:hypothetical protein
MPKSQNAKKSKCKKVKMSKSQKVKMSKSQNLKMAKCNLYPSLDGFDTDLKFHFNL